MNNKLQHLQITSNPLQDWLNKRNSKDDMYSTVFWFSLDNNINSLKMSLKIHYLKILLS